MTKPERLSFIANLCRKTRGTKVAVLSALPSEIREETALAKRHDDDQSILDEEVEVAIVSPALARMVKTKVRHLTPKQELDEEAQDHLTLREQGELARDLEAYRKTHPRQPSYSSRLWLWIMPADPFADMKRAEPVEPYTANSLCGQTVDQMANA